MYYYRGLSRAKLAGIFISVLALICMQGPAVYAATSLTAYPVPTNSSQPNFLLLGPDGNFWFPEATGDKIGKITPDGTITEYPLAAGSKPAQMAVGPDGNMWFTEVDSNKIGKITTAGVVTEYDIPTLSAQPAWITAGPDGNMWFTKRSGGIAKITTSGVITEYPTPGGMPGRVTAGPDGNVWFTTSGHFISGPDTVVKVTPGGTATEYVIGSGVSPTSIITGPDGNIWFTQTSANKIGKLTPSGVLTEYDLPGFTASYPGGLTIGPDDALWFSESGSNKIGTITTSGVITEYPLNIDTMNNPFPDEFVLMPGNVLWYASASFNQITVLRDWGPIDPAPTPTPAPPSAPDPAASSSGSPTPTVVTTVKTGKQPFIFSNLRNENFPTDPVTELINATTPPSIPSVSEPIRISNSESNSPATPNITVQDIQQPSNDIRSSKFIGIVLLLIAAGLLFVLVRRRYKPRA